MLTRSTGVVTRNFLALGAGEITARLITFATMIYLARALGVAAYGIIGFTFAVYLYFNRIADFAVESFGPSEIASDPDQTEQVAPSIITARLLLSAFLAAAVIIGGRFMLPEPDSTVLAIFALSLLAVGGSTRWIHIGLERTHSVALGRTVGELLRALLIVFLVRDAGDIANVAWAQLVGDMTTAVWLYLTLRRRGIRFRLELDTAVLRPIFHRAWPLVLSIMLGMVVYNSDVMFIRFFRDESEVGFYVAAFTLITFLGNLGATYSASLLPTLTRLGASGDGQGRLFHTAMAHVFAFSLPVAVGGSLLARPLILTGFGNEYAASITALQILLWSIPFLLFRNVLQAMLIAMRRQDQILRASVTAALVSVATNLYLIPRYGMLGAAISTVTTELIRTALIQFYVYGQGLSLTRFSRFWRTMVASLAMGIVLLLLYPLWLPVAVLLGGIIYVGTLALVGGIRLERGQLPLLRI